MIEPEPPADYIGRFFRHAFENGAGLRSGRLLFDLVQTLVGSNGEVQLYPVWDMQESAPPRGTIDVFLNRVDAESLSLKEQYLHRVRRREAGQ
jgi:hypothetical protein